MRVSIIILSFMFLSLDVTEATSAINQVTGLKVRHFGGQTFITWREVNPPKVNEGMNTLDIKKIKKSLSKENIRYTVYRSTKPITSLQDLRRIGSTGVLSCWNIEFYGRSHKRQGVSHRYVVKEGENPLPIGTGLYVHNPQTAGKYYYAVTYSRAGTEHKTLSEQNASQIPVEEIVGPGEPVLQRITKPDKFQYVKGATLKFYTRWEAPPHSSVENRPIDYVVGLPPMLKKPWVVGLHLHCWNGSLLNGYGWWDNNKTGSVLVASNQEPYDWWTGYNENFFGEQKKAAREKQFKDGVVRPYTMTRIFGFLDWLTTKHDIDLSRTFVAGNSMGGSGAVMCAIRYGNRIASCRSWVGVHIAGESPNFSKSYANVYGQKEWGIKYADGTDVWNYYDDVWYLKTYPKKETGFITFSNGKNDNGIGWSQAVKTIKAMQETKRPHLFIWGMKGHSQRTVYPKNLSQHHNGIDMRIDQSLPAFTACSLDDDFGTGSQLANVAKKDKKVDRFDGDSEGQVNSYLFWETDDIVDTAGSWEMTVGLIGKAPQDSCTVSLTPRRCQAFSVEPGTNVTWTNSSGGKVIQKGKVAADQWGLVTIENLQVGKLKNRISIRK